MTPFLGALTTFLAGMSWGDLLAFLIRMTAIAALGVTTCAIMRRASAASRHLVAVATLAALIGLPMARTLLPDLSLPILPRAVLTSPADENPSSPASWAPRARTPGLLSESASTAGTTASGARSEILFPPLAVLLTLAVSAALLLHALFSIFAAWTIVRRARRIEDATLRRDLEAYCERLGLRCEVDLRETASVAVPVMWGLVHPVLLLPVGARTWSRERLRVVFLHELAHVVRRDGLALLVTRAATSLFWFHPLVWKIARVARRECESACDDVVLASGERATEYAEHLLAIVRSMTRRDPLDGVAPAFAQASKLESRLASILRADRPREPISRSVFIATLTSALLLLVTAAAVHVVPTPAAAETKAPGPSDGQNWPEASTTVEAQSTQETTVWKEQTFTADDDLNAGERWFNTGREAFNERHFVRSASAYLSAAAVGYRKATSLYYAACALAKAGAVDDALNTLEAALEAGFDRPDLLASDDNLAALRSEARFRALLNRETQTDKTTEKRIEAPVKYESAGASWFSKKHASSESGVALMRAGEFDRAIAAFEAEIRLTSSSTAMYNLACAHALRGDKARAFDALERAIRNGFGSAEHMAEDEDLRSLRGDPRFYQLYRLTKDLELSNYSRGDDDDAESWQNSVSRFQRVVREHPDLGRAWANLGYAQLQIGDPKASAASYRRALELGHREGTMMYNLACCAAQMGDIDEAFKWLDRSENAGMDVGEYVIGDSDLDPLRSDKRFRALLDQWDRQMAAKHRDKKKD